MTIYIISKLDRSIYRPVDNIFYSTFEEAYREKRRLEDDDLSGIFSVFEFGNSNLPSTLFQS